MSEEIKLEKEERQPCEVYTRVMGYIKPTNTFNVGKKSEYDNRKCFTEEKAVETLENLPCSDNHQG